MSFVTLDTSVGSVTFELYSQHAPKASPRGAQGTPKERGGTGQLTGVTLADVQKLCRAGQAGVLQWHHLSPDNSGQSQCFALQLDSV